LNNTVVIAGAGHAAGQLIASLKQKKFDGEIVLLGDEKYLPYQRPPLSKKYLAGELKAERLLFKPKSFYEDENLTIALETRVCEISCANKMLRTEDGKDIPYGTLVLALGSRARQVPVPGVDLQGVHYLRGIVDVDLLRRDIAPGKKVVIVGAGYIGLEVAAVCSQLGLDVTVVEMADRVMSRVVSPQVSTFFQQVHEQHDVKFRLSTGLQAIHGKTRQMQDLMLITVLWSTTDAKAVTLTYTQSVIVHHTRAMFTDDAFDLSLYTTRWSRQRPPRVTFAVSRIITLRCPGSGPTSTI
jgi:3-phenylpropionate/trans-cinnamate dioxygenase ferredoxin reductase subunit